MPVRPLFLQDYEHELTSTAAYIRDLEKEPILEDAITEGAEYFTESMVAYILKTAK